MKAEFSALLAYSSVQSHMTLQKFILICWFAAQETFLIIINVENNCAVQYFCGNHVKSFQDSVINMFIWNRDIL